MNYNIFFAGVGGQGILTIGEVLAETAYETGVPVNFYPSKGMAQRGGFVKAQLRFGREAPGPNIPQRGADLVIAMEPSESLKAVPYIRPGGEFVLYGDIWAPTAVSLGKATYPSLTTIYDEVEGAGARMIYIDPAGLPVYEGDTVHANLFVLGVIMGQTALGRLIPVEDVEQVIHTRFRRGGEANLYAFWSGMAIPLASL